MASLIDTTQESTFSAFCDPLLINFLIQCRLHFFPTVHILYFRHVKEWHLRMSCSSSGKMICRFGPGDLTRTKPTSYSTDSLYWMTWLPTTTKDSRFLQHCSTRSVVVANVALLLCCQLCTELSPPRSTNRLKQKPTQNTSKCEGHHPLHTTLPHKNDSLPAACWCGVCLLTGSHQTGALLLTFWSQM